MKRRKRLLAFVLAGVMITSNIAYAAPESGTENVESEVVDTLSLNPNESAGGESTSDPTQSDSSASDQGTGVTDAAGAEDTQSVEDNSETTAEAPEAEDKSEVTDSSKSEAESEAEDTQEEATSEESEETASTLYEVEFTSPEKHGDILRMDDTVIEDGVKLEADENGQVQFKVKADEGYQVDKVVNKSNGKELTLVDELYYKLQIEENVTIEVHYKTIPEDEDSDDADDDKQDDSAAEETSDKSDSETEEVSRPEQTLEVTASDGAVITITAPEGALPEGAQVSAKPVESVSVEKAVEQALETEEKELQEYKAYDITIQDKDGNEIQPEKEI